MPEGVNKELYMVFGKYNARNKAMLCLWRNGQLNCAMHEPSWEQGVVRGMRIYKREPSFQTQTPE
jgi:hypothetical protein